MKSIGQILRGDSSNDGFRHVTTTGVSYTVGPAKDGSGGTYVSIGRPDGGKQTTVIGQNGQVIKRVQNPNW